MCVHLHRIYKHRWMETQSICLPSSNSDWKSMSIRLTHDSLFSTLIWCPRVSQPGRFRWSTHTWPRCISHDSEQMRGVLPQLRSGSMQREVHQRIGCSPRTETPLHSAGNKHHEETHLLETLQMTFITEENIRSCSYYKAVFNYIGVENLC